MPGGTTSLSLTSSIFGFISFAFTIFTFIRVFWGVILTLFSAERDMPQALDNLRSELHGERSYFKSMLRRQRSRSRTAAEKASGKTNRKPIYHEDEDVAVLSILYDSVRTLLRRLKRLEKPFLSEPAAQLEKDVERSEESVRGNYAPMTLRRRWAWLRCKDDVINMAEQVNRIQTRRIACDTANGLIKLHNLERTVDDLEDRLWDIEEHLMGERLDDGKIYVKRRRNR